MTTYTNLYADLILQAKQAQEQREKIRLEIKELLAQLSLEQEQFEQKQLEQEQLEQERLEQERLKQEQLEQEQLEQEQLEQERLKLLKQQERQEQLKRLKRLKLLEQLEQLERLEFKCNLLFLVRVLWIMLSVSLSRHQCSHGAGGGGSGGQLSRSAAFVTIYYILCKDVESNPGPTTSTGSLSNKKSYTNTVLIYIATHEDRITDVHYQQINPSEEVPKNAYVLKEMLTYPTLKSAISPLLCTVFPFSKVPWKKRPRDWPEDVPWKDPNKTQREDLLKMLAHIFRKCSLNECYDWLDLIQAAAYKKTSIPQEMKARKGGLQQSLPVSNIKLIQDSISLSEPSSASSTTPSDAVGIPFCMSDTDEFQDLFRQPDNQNYNFPEVTTMNAEEMPRAKVSITRPENQQAGNLSVDSTLLNPTNNGIVIPLDPEELANPPSPSNISAISVLPTIVATVPPGHPENSTPNNTADRATASYDKVDRKSNHSIASVSLICSAIQLWSSANTEGEVNKDLVTKSDGWSDEEKLRLKKMVCAMVDDLPNKKTDTSKQGQKRKFQAIFEGEEQTVESTKRVSPSSLTAPPGDRETHEGNKSQAITSQDCPQQRLPIANDICQQSPSNNGNPIDPNNQGLCLLCNKDTVGLNDFPMCEKCFQSYFPSTV